MAQITFKGSPVQTCGTLPAVGDSAPSFVLTGSDLSDATLESFAGNRKVLSIVPSLDTSVCAASARAFNEKAASLDNTVVLTISADLPFAQKRFCEAEGIDRVQPLSTFRSSFGLDYGMTMTDGPLKGLLGRAIVVLDESNRVVYTELVPEIAQEPNYADALGALGA